MKITIEPSADQMGEEYPYPKVTLEVPRDDVMIEEAADMMRQALLGWGFSEALVDEVISPR